MGEPAYTLLDLRGVPCPMNWVRIKLVLEEMEKGGKLEVFVDGGEPLHNVPRNVREEGHKLLKVREMGGYFQLTIERGWEG